MPTPQEKAAQTRERKKQEAEQRRLEEEQRELAEQQEREEELRQGLRMKQAYDMLLSEVTGLYDEMDKLAKKAPNEPVTNLQLKIINSFIKKAKHLLSGDTIINEVEVFVAAGDNPEYRDAVTVLRQIRQGLERFKAKDYIFTKPFRDELSEYEIDDEEELSDYFADMSNSNDGATE
jgi:poly-D-alanine transfer protein DltD